MLDRIAIDRRRRDDAQGVDEASCRGNCCRCNAWIGKKRSGPNVCKERAADYGNGILEGFSRGVRELIDGATALGLQVFITELDGNDDAVATTNMTERNKIVANAYGSYLTAALERPEVRAVLTWGVSDKNSWLNNGTKFRKQHPERLQRPLPFDPDYLPVPAFFAMRTSFEKTMNR
jgi:hypothetical protein